jgi:hypothetical protein
MIMNDGLIWYPELLYISLIVLFLLIVVSWKKHQQHH